MPQSPFERIQLPTPFQVGPVNAYLAGRTIVDPGPDSEAARDALVDGLAARGLDPTDVERVLVTHPHPDHFGQASRLAADGATVCASPAAAPILRAFGERLEYEQTYFAALFEAHGMDAETARTVTQLPEAFLEYAPSTPVDHELADGDAVTVAGRTLTTRELDGHAVGELAWAFDADASGGADGDSTDADAAHGDAAHPDATSLRTALVGDHVLAETTPNPFLQPPEPGAGDGPADGDGDATSDATTDADDTARSDETAFSDADLKHDSPAALDDARPRVLPAYNDSLATLRDVGYDRLLPGHGDPIEDPPARIDALLRAHEDRTAAVLELVDGPTTATEVVRGLFPELPVIEYFSGMSEVLGHLDVLVRRGEVERRVLDADAGELGFVRGSS